MPDYYSEHKFMTIADVTFCRRCNAAADTPAPCEPIPAQKAAATKRYKSLISPEWKQAQHEKAVAAGQRAAVKVKEEAAKPPPDEHGHRWEVG